MGDVAQDAVRAARAQHPVRGTGGYL